MEDDAPVIYGLEFQVRHLKGGPMSFAFVEYEMINFTAVRQRIMHQLLFYE